MDTIAGFWSVLRAAGCFSGGSLKPFGAAAPAHRLAVVVHTRRRRVLTGGTAPIRRE
jgi:hypothetical protein